VQGNVQGPTLHIFPLHIFGERGKETAWPR
jgi:hypothetical protein